MSAITSDWAPIETEMPVAPPVASGKAYWREEEFRSALDRYIAGWVAKQQKRRTAETSARNSYFAVVRRFAGWVRSGYAFART
jgi:hypothetical protein